MVNLFRERKAEGALLLFASSLVVATEAFLHPWLIKMIFDEAVSARDMGRLFQLAAYYLALGLALNPLSYAVALWERSLQNRILHTLTSDLLSAYYRTDYRTILAKGEGYFVARVYRDASEWISVIPSIRRMVSSVVVTVVFLGMLFYLSWQGAVALIAVTPILAYVSRVFGKKIEAVTGSERDNEGAALEGLNRCLAAFKMARVGTLGEQALGVYKQGVGKFLESVYHNLKLVFGYRTVTSLSMVGADSLSVVIGAVMVIRGTLSFGGYIAFVNVFWRAVHTVMGVFHPLAELYRAAEIADRIQDLLKTTAAPSFAIGDSVVLRDVRFAYNGVPVLRQVDLTLRQGERVLILGPNGAGKTTLANILAGYLAPDTGDVTLPAKISATTIPIEFPPLKVQDLPIPTELLKAFGLGGLGDEASGNLSAGQKQKLAIALTLSQDAELYVFDEPLSNVDVASTDAIMAMIMDKTKGQTVVAIMHGGEQYHRLFDRVFTLDGGVVVPLAVH
jgi:ATP-binding cassette subfamily B protein